MADTTIPAKPFVKLKTTSDEIVIKREGAITNSSPYRSVSFPATGRFFQNTNLQNSPNWKQAAKHVIASFRADSARYPGDPSFTELINDLLKISNTFSEGWNQYDIRGAIEGQKTLHHPTLGILEFEQLTLQLPANPDIKIVILNGTTDL
ncbi:hypothetical protein D3C77_498260 [compost metagenome]